MRFARSQVELDGVLRDAVGILRLRRHVFAHRHLARAVDRDGAGEDEALHLGGDRLVDQVHRADDVVGVVEAADEVAQAFGGVGGEVVDVLDAVLCEDPLEQRLVEDRSGVKRDAEGTLAAKPPERSSRPTTSWPASSSACATCEPMKPAAPVTSTATAQADLADRLDAALAAGFLRLATVCAPNFFVKRSTRPSVSSSFCRPVKNGWQFEQISR